MTGLKIFGNGSALRLLVNLERSGHRTTSPTVYWWKPVRTASVDYGFWSHLSLRSRSGMELSQAWPLLSRLVSAPLIPARPFGLGWRFDEAPLVTPIVVSRQRYQAHPRNGWRVAYGKQIGNSHCPPRSKPLVETVKQGSMRSTRAGIAPKINVIERS